VARLGHVRLVAHGLQAQWRRRAAPMRIVSLRRQQEDYDTAQDVPWYVLRVARKLQALDYAQD